MESVTPMIHVLAEIEVADGRRGEFLEHFRALVPAVRAEEGCLEYGPTVDASTSIAAQAPVRPHVVTVIERWESPQALAAHLAAPHMDAFRAQCGALIRSVTIRITEPA
jgi:quinol monooxygenase YgiN